MPLSPPKKFGNGNARKGIWQVNFAFYEIPVKTMYGSWQSLVAAALQPCYSR